MKKKIGTILDEELILRTKQAALVHKKSLSQFLEEALRVYLVMIEHEEGEKKKSIVQDTSGVMKISRSALGRVMEEEGVYET